MKGFLLLLAITAPVCPAQAPRYKNSTPTASADGAVIVTSLAGSDLGAQVQAGIAQLGNACGTLLIPSGSYTWSTPDVVISPCMTISGNDAVIRVASLKAPFLVVAAPLTSSTPSGLYTSGGIRDVTFVGPGSSTPTIGLWIGGDLSGQFTRGSTSYAQFLDNFYDLHIRGFGAGIEIAAGAQTAFFGGSIEGNGIGITMQNGAEPVENVNLHGTQIFNNVHYGFQQPAGASYIELNCYGCSFDYNNETDSSGAQISFNSGILNMFGGHFEGTVLPFVRVPVPVVGTTTELNMSGVGFTYANPKSTTSSFLEIDGVNDTVNIGPGNVINTTGGTAASLVRWNTIPASVASRFRCEPYQAFAAGNGFNLPAYQVTSAAATPVELSYPVYNQYGILTGMVSNLNQTAYQITSEQAAFDLGNQMGANDSLIQMRFHTAGSSYSNSQLQTDGTSFSFENSNGKGRAPVNTGPLNATSVAAANGFTGTCAKGVVVVSGVVTGCEH